MFWLPSIASSTAPICWLFLALAVFVAPSMAVARAPVERPGSMASPRERFETGLVGAERLRATYMDGVVRIQMVVIGATLLLVMSAAAREALTASRPRQFMVKVAVLYVFAVTPLHGIGYYSQSAKLRALLSRLEYMDEEYYAHNFITERAAIYNVSMIWVLLVLLLCVIQFSGGRIRTD